MADRPLHASGTVSIHVCIRYFSSSLTIEQSEIIDKYERLSRQSEKLRQRLSLSIPSTSPLSPPTDDESPQSSPKRRMSTPGYPFSFSATPSWPSVQPIIPSDEEHLFDINQQIKATLTELINCEEVKHDKKFRAWIQAKLMEAEHELKRQRKRRSSVDVETMRAISEHLGHSPASSY